jgi:hypothetical protein
MSVLLMQPSCTEPRYRNDNGPHGEVQTHHQRWVVVGQCNKETCSRGRAYHQGLQLERISTIPPRVDAGSATITG